MSIASLHTTIVIIGAGPAGSAAAIALARTGIRPADILILEAKAFPRVKVCGEFVSPAATQILEALLPPDRLLAAGARRVHEMVLELGLRERPWRMPAPAWTLSRRTLDDLLLEHAREAGVRIQQPARVQSLDYAEQGVTITLADASVVQARIVLHADGSGRHDPAGAVPARPGVVGFKCHYRPSVPVVGVRMRSAPGAYIGTVQVERGLATCAMTVASRLIADFKGDADAMLAHLWPAWSASARTTDWLSCGVAGSPYIAPGHPRSFRLGNAAAAVEPVGGEGIGMALWSGWTLAQLMVQDGPEGTLNTPARVQSAFAAAYRSRLRIRRSACSVAAWALARPSLVSALWPLLAAPGALRGFYRLSGKPAHPSNPQAHAPVSRDLV